MKEQVLIIKYTSFQFGTRPKALGGMVLYSLKFQNFDNKATLKNYFAEA